MNKENPLDTTDMEGSTGVSIFRWESASGLEHTCYACPTKANHPKARQSCYGIHSIPCSRYHTTMHAIGTSHNCFACIQSDNQHALRHKKIAELLAEWRSLDEADNAACVKNKKSNGNVLRERDANAALRNQQDHDPENGHENAQDNGEHDDIDTSSVSNASVVTKTPKLSKSDVRAAKREAKSAKSKRKSLKNQTKHIVTVKASDVEHVNLILHGDQNSTESHPLASDKCIEDVMNRNRKYVSYIAEHKALLLKEVGKTRKAEQEARWRKARKRKDRSSVSHSDEHQHKAGILVMDEEEEALVNAVLIKFAVPVEPTTDGNGSPATPITPKRASSGSSRASSQEKAMVLAQLRVAIAEDLQKHENEQRQTCIRAGGFWRYVGRQVFERMMEISERIDWKTGAVKKPGTNTVAAVGDAEIGNGAGAENDDAADGAGVHEWVADVAGEEAGEGQDRP